MALGGRIPNLFIVGAPKCGTSAMSDYLSGHPDIFMSGQNGIKEPKFFCTDLWYPEQSHPRSWNEYLDVFRSAPKEVRYIGEATPRYLQSKEAIPNILKVSENPYFIVMLRNPVELTASQHNQRVKEGREDVDFERAWCLQDARLAGRSLPPNVSDGRCLHYAQHAMLGMQVQRLFDWVGKENVHWIFFDDFKKDPSSCYRGVLRYLSLPDDGRTEFERRNVSVTYRWRSLNDVLNRMGRIRRKIGIGGLGIHKYINRFNAGAGRPPLSSDFKQELQNYFRNDIDLLSSLTGRNLSNWYSD